MTSLFLLDDTSCHPQQLHHSNKGGHGILIGLALSYKCSFPTHKYSVKATWVSPLYNYGVFCTYSMVLIQLVYILLSNEYNYVNYTQNFIFNTGPYVALDSLA